jgi:hypothetical protein
MIPNKERTQVHLIRKSPSHTSYREGTKNAGKKKRQERTGKKKTGKKTPTDRKEDTHRQERRHPQKERRGKKTPTAFPNQINPNPVVIDEERRHPRLFRTKLILTQW